jgi:hypothetical protein
MQIYSDRGELKQYDIGGSQAILKIHAGSPDFTMERTLYRDADGTLRMYNGYINVEKSGEGVGSRIFADQVRALTERGVSRIIADAVGEPGDRTHNGYYTLARQGYDGEIRPRIQELLKADTDLPPALRRATRIQDIMATAEGRAWWKANGTSFDGTFDLTPGSKSHQILDAYLKAKGIEAPMQPAKAYNQTALMRKWNTQHETYSHRAGPLAKTLDESAMRLELELRRGRGPGTPTYDALEQQFKDAWKHADITLR